MNNNVIISAWLDVPKAAEKLKKFAPKGGRREFIQFAPERGEISAHNGPQLHFLPVEFEAVERGEKYRFANCAVGACSPKDIKAIAGRRVQMVVTSEECTEIKWQAGRRVEYVYEQLITTFYSDNGKLLCSYSTSAGNIIPPAGDIYNAAELTAYAVIEVDKKAAKTLANLLKICVLDNVDGKQFAAVSVEFAPGESVAVIRSYLFGDDASTPVFTIKEHILKLSAPAVGGGLYYVQAQFLIDALKNDLTLYFAPLRGKECKVITKSLNGFLISMGCNTEAEKQQLQAARFDAGEKIEAEARAAESCPDVDNVPAAAESEPQAAAVQSVENVPAAPKAPEIDASPVVDIHTPKAPPKATQVAPAGVDSVQAPEPTTAKNAPPGVLELHRKLVVFFGRPALRRPRGDTLAKWSKAPAPVDYSKPP